MNTLRIHGIPYHLRNTIERLDLPIYLDLTGEDCRPPQGLALGDTLMMLGLIRNQGRPVRLHMEPGGLAELVTSHPLVSEVVKPESPSERFAVTRLAVGRTGRSQTWVSRTTHPWRLPVLPTDQVRANPILAHSLYYGYGNLDDRPSVFIDPSRPPALAGLSPREKPLLVVYPLNPGRKDHFWQDPAWWTILLRQARERFAVVAVGAEDYGELATEADVCLPMSDPASTLIDLAWLLGRAAAFVGRDGGLSHLAAAVNPQALVLWDSMASYRYWACSQVHNIIFSNPYTFRYPQTARIDLDEVKSEVRSLCLKDAKGRETVVDLPEVGYEDRIREVFGGLDPFLMMIANQREVEEDRGGVQAWMARPEVKEAFYAQSLAFAFKALAGELPPGANWVAPVVP